MGADPFTLMLLVGGGLQAAGQIQEGRIAEAQGKFEKKIALRNQKSLERQAKAEIEAAGVEETKVARREKIFRARQRAGMAKGGIGLAGASLSFLTDTAFQFSMERNLVLRRGIVRGRELRERGKIIAAQGRWAKTLGTQVKRSSYVKAGASILGAVGAAGGLPSSPGTTAGTSASFGTTPAFTTGQRYSTFSGGGLTIPR